MHRPEHLSDLPVARWRATADESCTPRWELEAALAVLERAREEWAALVRDHVDQTEPHPQTREILRRRLQSAQQLVARIQSKLQAAGH